MLTRVEKSDKVFDVVGACVKVAEKVIVLKELEERPSRE